MSIMDMFSNFISGNSASTQQQPQQVQQPQQTQPGNIPAGAGATDPNNSTVPPQPVKGPLDDFATLWQPVETDPSKQSTGAVLGNIDPQKVMEAAGKTDFSKVVNQETLAKINAGGPEAMTAMMEAMNRMAQQVYGSAALASSKMVEQAANKMQERFKSDLPAEFKRLNLSNDLRDSNPLFNNPAIAPIISAMEQQFTVKYPNATAREITEMAKTYVAGLGDVFSPKKTDQTQQNAGTDSTDWSKWLS